MSAKSWKERQSKDAVLLVRVVLFSSLGLVATLGAAGMTKWHGYDLLSIWWRLSFYAFGVTLLFSGFFLGLLWRFKGDRRPMNGGMNR